MPSLPDLAPELRNRIYHLVLVRDRKTFHINRQHFGKEQDFYNAFLPRYRRVLHEINPGYTCSHTGYRGSDFLSHDHFDRRSIALTQVSRMIRADTLPIFYGNNTFSLGSIDLQSVPRWAWGIGHVAVSQIRR